MAEFGVFALQVGCKSGACGEFGYGSANREFLIHNAKIRIGLDNGIHDWSHVYAVRALIVKEFNNSYFAVWIAADRIIGLVEQGIGKRSSGLLGLLHGFLCLFILFAL